MSYVITLKLYKRKSSKPFTVFMLCWEVGKRQKLHFMSIIGKKSSKSKQLRRKNDQKHYSIFDNFIGF